MFQTKIGRDPQQHSGLFDYINSKNKTNDTIALVDQILSENGLNNLIENNEHDYSCFSRSEKIIYVLTHYLDDVRKIHHSIKFLFNYEIRNNKKFITNLNIYDQQFVFTVNCYDDNGNIVKFTDFPEYVEIENKKLHHNINREMLNFLYTALVTKINRGKQ